MSSTTRTLWKEGALRRIDHPSYGEIVVSESPLRYTDITNVPYKPSGELGSDTRTILMSLLNLPPTQADALAAELQQAVV